MTAVAEHPTTLDTRTHYVYRLFDAADRLLYVGMTNDPGQRLREHKRSRPWWPEVYRHSVEKAPTRADAYFIEATAILKEMPAYNVDIPSLSRYDTLRSRTTAADPLTAEDRIASLEHQLRESRRENFRAASSDRELASAHADLARLAAENSALRGAAVVATEDHQKATGSLVKAVNTWRDLAEQLSEDLKAREQARVFVVEGPRTIASPASRVVAPTTAPVANRRTLLQRIIGG